MEKKHENKNRYNKKIDRTRPDQVQISVVIPLLNEEESLKELSKKLAIHLKDSAGDQWEVIFIDDGSTDNSFRILKEINKTDKRYRAVRFRRNYGKAAALQIGFNKARGNVIITMDADLQDDPAEIKNLVAKLKDGYDLVSGWKKKRYDPISKTFPSRIFNSMVSTATGIKLHDFNCGLKGYRKEAAKSLNLYGEMHRFTPALAHHDGFKVTEIVVQHHPRKYGASKFGPYRMVKGFLDLITVTFLTRFMKKPMHFFGALGILLILAGTGLDLYLSIEWVLGNTYLNNRPLLFLGIVLIIVGVQSVSMGLIGEMMVKNTEKKIYSIREYL
ncbi:glycosyltransferase family 2 protein [Candidatus Kapabacteria bacterium]|nr:glycosyltransferase family 2 protein [Candidatus Kapabacteria bacterium]